MRFREILSRLIHMNILAAIQSLKTKNESADGIELQGLITEISTNGHCFLALVLTLPFLQPIPTMGLSAPSGAVIAAAGMALAFKAQPWIPQKYRTLKLPKNIMASSLGFLDKVFARLGSFLKPRWTFMFNPGTRILNGFLLAIHGILMALPLPIPGSNSFPAWSILLIALAELEEDGILLWIGYLVSIASFIFFASLAWGAQAGIEKFL